MSLHCRDSLRVLRNRILSLLIICDVSKYRMNNLLFLIDLDTIFWVWRRFIIEFAKFFLSVWLQLVLDLISLLWCERISRFYIKFLAFFCLKQLVHVQTYDFYHLLNSFLVMHFMCKCLLHFLQTTWLSGVWCKLWMSIF